MEARRGRAQHLANAHDLGLGNPEVERALHEQRDRSRVDGGRGVQMTVGRCTRHAREAGARTDAAAVVRKARDVGSGIAA